MQRLRGMGLEALLNVQVDTVTKQPENHTLAPASVSVITADDIAAFGYESVAEILSYSVSFVETDDLVMHNFGVRGIHAGLNAGSRMLKFMLNGQPIALRSSQQNVIGLGLIPLHLIERIEIIRGPVSALYGADAFIGTINIITRDGKTLAELGTRLSLSASHIEAAGSGARVELAGGGTSEEFSWLAGVTSAYQQRGGLELPRRSPLYHLFSADPERMTASENDASYPVGAYARLQWDVTPQRQLSFSLHYQGLDAQQVFSDLKPLRFSGVSRVAVEQAFARLDWEEKLDERWQMRSYAAWGHGHPYDADQIEVGAQGYYLERDFSYRGLDLGSELIWKPRSGDTVLFGVDYTHDAHHLVSFTQVQRDSGVATQLNPPQHKNLTNIGVYWQWQHQFSALWLDSRWRTLLGYRYDDHSETGGQSSFRLGLVGELPHKIVLKLLFGQSFQAPAAELLYRDAVQGGDIVGNPNLHNQQASTAELSLLAPLGKHWHISATLYLTQLEDLALYQSTQSNFIARNSTDSETLGLELEARYEYGNWRGYVNAAWQDTRLEDNPYNLFVLNEREDGALMPDFSANLGISYYYPAWKLSLALNNRYVGQRPASTQNVNLAQRFYNLDDYLESSLTISTRLFSYSQRYPSNLRFQVRDLWDSQYVNPGFGGIDIPSYGRRYLLSWEQTF